MPDQNNESQSPKNEPKPAKYLGVDMETTGLDPAKDRIVELAWVVLDEDLVEIDRAEYRLQVNSEVLLHCAALEMHLATGLIGYVDGLPVVLTSLGDGPAAPCALSEVEAMLVRVISRWFSGRPILAGQSVHFDRAVLQHWMPDAASYLHHRHLDARTVLLLRPDFWCWPQPSTPHRAMPDLLASIETLRIARRLMVSPILTAEAEVGE